MFAEEQGSPNRFADCSDDEKALRRGRVQQLRQLWGDQHVTCDDNEGPYNHASVTVGGYTLHVVPDGIPGGPTTTNLLEFDCDMLEIVLRLATATEHDADRAARHLLAVAPYPTNRSIFIDWDICYEAGDRVSSEYCTDDCKLTLRAFILLDEQLFTIHYSLSMILTMLS